MEDMASKIIRSLTQKSSENLFEESPDEGGNDRIREDESLSLMMLPQERLVSMDCYRTLQGKFRKEQDPELEKNRYCSTVDSCCCEP